jgi:hypothetical protein
MENININDIFGEKKKHYNSIPVAFCSRCLSLNIRITTDNEDYCDSCGNVDIVYEPIEVWEELAKTKYGEQFVIESKYGR